MRKYHRGSLVTMSNGSVHSISRIRQHHLSLPSSTPPLSTIFDITQHHQHHTTSPPTQHHTTCTFITHVLSSHFHHTTSHIFDMNSTQDSKVGRAMKLMNPIWQLRMHVFSRSHMGLISMFLFLSSSPLDISNKEGNENAPASFYDSPCIKNSDRNR
jgi:hypothetical protein